MKKKTGMFVSTVSTVMLLAACGGNTGEAENEGEAPDENSGNEAMADIEPQEWRIVTEETEGQVQDVYAHEFADTLDELSGGQINLDVYAFGELGSEVDQVEQLRDGIIEFAVISPGFTGTLVPEGNLFALQFLFPDDLRETQNILDDSEAINETLRANYEEHSISPLAFWTEGAMQWTGNSPITSPEDFEGFQMRTQESPLILRSYEAYNASPTAMSWDELYTGLQQGQVEGQENPLFFIEDANFHEVQDHLTISNHNHYVTMTTANTEFYEELDEGTREVVDEAVEQMRDRAFEIQEEQNEGALERIEDADDTPTEVNELSEEERDMFRELAEPVRDFYREEEGDDAAEILDELESEFEDIE